MKWLRALLVAVLIPLAACGPTTDQVEQPQPHPLVVVPGTTTAPPVVDTFAVIILENHSTAQVAKYLPKVTKIGNAYGRSTNGRANCKHPSQPNYIGLSSGICGKTKNKIATLKQPDVWNGALANGRTMKVYCQSLPASLSARRKDSGKWAARHCPTVPFVSGKTNAANFAKYTVSTTQLTGKGIRDVDDGTLPNVMAIIPDNDHNWHDGTAKQADDYVSGLITLIQSGPQYKANRVAIVVTADEDNGVGTNDIPMYVIYPSLEGSKPTSTAVSLFSVGGFLADVGHSPRLGGQKTAPDFGKTFGLTPS